MRRNLRIYEIETRYIEYLGDCQEHIFLQNEGNNKRKYIGVVLEVDKNKYFIPLSSFKNKHKNLKERVDFIKIKDYAVININNMIPVPES